MKITLDRLTVCGNLFGDLEGFYSRTMEVQRRSFSKYPYRDAIHFLDGSILQIAEKDAYMSGNIKQLRYEFNPNNFKFEKLHMAVIGLMKDAHMTRLDIAFDVHDVDMSRWKWIDTKGRPYRVYYSGVGQVETWYIGGKDSNVLIRIYNKAKEQKMKGKVWWRVEVQLRGDAAQTAGLMSMSGINLEMNPFEHITPVVDGNFPELDIKKRAMVNYLIANPSGFSELASQARSEYRKLVRLVGSWECIDFYDIWQKKSSLVGSEVRSWLSLAKPI